jgi:hypothetical protein
MLNCIYPATTLFPATSIITAHPSKQRAVAAQGNPSDKKKAPFGARYSEG